ncbi:hypothetical protein GCM10009678_87770 [Actinomadura kijaniata]|uniref:Putative ATPase/DNA-binding CsgD family transcriptional regulator n=2 Tax=Actinomadura TaxID=1988 RepID=A0A7W3QJV3_ACTNM|nr:tetratricopeptide repeat protein [Actinomadura namibiensis]MBA8949844.1 putative ATPase/DNA-binding CsgD family transcriptional regulator [Actinomadura namibiensis]
MTPRLEPDRHNLPAETTRFVGRERDTAELAALLPAERLVTLTGVGGIGKTRLARQVAAGTLGAFEDGVWLVPLADVHDPALVPQAVAAVLGVAEEPGRSQAGTVVAALAPRRPLLVLDNCEHLVDACAAFAERLLTGCPRLHLLATSREPLRVPGEVVWRVPPLEGGAAVRLFADRAAAVRPDFGLTERNAAVVARLARALDGMPLALELAAARVAFLTVEQITERLDERFRLLVRGSRTAARRQRTLRATVDWSHDLLDADERAVLRRLSVFAGGWTLEAAERVCGAGGVDVLHVLGELTAKSLVVAEHGRYRLLETIRHYAAERLADAGEADAVAERHRVHFVELAERLEWTGWRDPAATWEERLAAFREVRAELDNLRAALDACLRHDATEAGLRLCTATRWYWMIRGGFRESRQGFERCFALPRGGVPPAVRAAARTAYGQAVYEHDELDLAASCAREGLRLHRELGDRQGVHAAAGLLARVDLRRGRIDDAERALAEIRESARADDPFNEALALTSLAALAVRRGRLRSAARLYEESLALYRRMEHYGMAANALAGLGVTAHAEGDPARALRHYRAAHEITTRLDDFRSQRARCLAGIGAAALDLDDPPAARRHLSESLELTARTGQRLGVARILELFAALAAHEGDPARAVRIAGAADAFREAAGVPASPGSGARREALLERIRADLGGPAVEQLWSEGRALPPDRAIAHALEPPGGTAGDAPPAAPRRPPSTLTPREREVAQLISRGLTNRAIAEELYISPGTAGRHVANILTKLGLRSRAQIAAWWTQNSGSYRE